VTLSKAKVKELRELSRKKVRNGEGKFVIEGLRLTQEAVNSDFEIVEAMYTEDAASESAGKALVQRLRKKTPNVLQIPAREMKLIADTVTAQGFIAVVRRKVVAPDSVLRAENIQSVLVAFDAVSDPGNLGSMIRTCDWFGVQGVLLGQNCVELNNPKVLRGTMGGVFHLPIAEEVDLLSFISRAKSMDYKAYVTDIAGETHFDHVRYPHKVLFIFGNEAWGVSDQVKKLADVRVAIRRYGSAESLNVGVACGIVLSALHRLYDE
jgi:TrmH family RNA methyltransferase